MEVRPRAPGPYHLSAWYYQYISYRYSILSPRSGSAPRTSSTYCTFSSTFVPSSFRKPPSAPNDNLFMLSTQMSYGNLAKILVTGRARIRITSIISAQPRSISPSAAVVVRCRHNRDLLMYCGPRFSAQCLPSTSTSPGSWSRATVLRSK